MKRSIPRRLISFLLVFLSVLSMIPMSTPEAKAEGAEDILLPQIELTPCFVKNTGDTIDVLKGSATTGSIAHSVSLSDEKKVVAGSFCGAKIKLDVFDSKGNHPSGYTLYLLKTTGEKPPETPDKLYLDDNNMASTTRLSPIRRTAIPSTLIPTPVPAV